MIAPLPSSLPPRSQLIPDPAAPQPATTATSQSSYRRPPAAINADPAWIDARFERAVDIVQSLPRSGPIQTNYDDKLLLYSVYKQATEGDIKTSRPNMLDVLGRAKWDAWNRKRGLSEDDAKRQYVEGLIKILKGFADRSQAVDLIRELEDFTIDVRASILTGSLPNTDDSESDATTSTAPPARTTSRHLQPPNPAGVGGKSSSSKKKRAPASVGGAGGAPSLPGYGPPRTISDSPRAPIKKRRGGREQPPPPPPEQHLDESESESSESGTDLEEAARRIPPPQHAWQPPPPSRILSPPPLGPYPPNAPIGRATASPGPPGQQYGMAMMGAPYQSFHQQQHPQVQQSTIHQSLPSLPSASIPNVALTTSLDRITTSLTALHERLNDLEHLQRLVGTTSTTSSSFLGSLVKFLRLLFMRFVLRKKEIQGSSGGIKAALGEMVEGARRTAVDICLVVLVGWFVRGRLAGPRLGGAGPRRIGE